MKTHIKRPNVDNGEGATRFATVCGFPATADRLAVAPEAATCDECNPAAMLSDLGGDPLKVEDFVCEFVAESMAETMSAAFDRECACRMSARDMRRVCLDMLRSGVQAARRLAADRAEDAKFEGDQVRSVDGAIVGTTDVRHAVETNDGTVVQ